MRGAQMIPLGFDLTGAAVEIPLAHMAVTGQTQASGKTTTLEAAARRCGKRVLAFRTKRGESAFGFHDFDDWRTRPYFRDRADWQFVTSILDATLMEKNKFLRPWIIKICRNTRSLKDVQREVRHALRAARGISEGVYTQLDAYLDLIVPEIERAELAPQLALGPGLSVMDLTDFGTPMQMLFVQSALDWIAERESGVVTIIPEAWEFVPEGKGSPVKHSAIALARKGAALGNFLWVDSQDMAGVDKTILRACAVWLIGVQREANEIKRNLANIPKGIKRPDAGDIARLERGRFFACWDQHCVRTYVWPSWLDRDEARRVAQQAGAPPDRGSGRFPRLTHEEEALAVGKQGLVVGKPASREQAAAAAERLARLPDDQIDTSDIPEATDAQLARASWRMPADKIPESPMERTVTEAEAEKLRTRNAELEGQNAALAARVAALESAIRSEGLDPETRVRAEQEFAKSRGGRFPTEDETGAYPGSLAADKSGAKAVPVVMRVVKGAGESAAKASPVREFADDLREGLYQWIKARLAEEAPALIIAAQAKHEIEVRLERRTLQIDGKSLPGRVARLIAGGFFREPRGGGAARKELERTGSAVHGGNLSRTLGELVKDGFLTEEPSGYQAVPDMVVRIVEAP